MKDPKSLENFGTKASRVKAERASIRERSEKSISRGKGKTDNVVSSRDSEKGASPEEEETEFPSSGILEGCSFTFKDGENNERTVELGKVLFRPHGILDRGTIVVEVTCACAHEHCRDGCDWKDLQLVMKLSFASKARHAEVDLINSCTKLAKEDSRHAWVLKHLPEVHASFTVPFGPGTVQHQLKEYFKDAYEERELRGSIQSKLDSLMTLNTAREFGQAIYDIVQCAFDSALFSFTI